MCVGRALPSGSQGLSPCPTPAISSLLSVFAMWLGSAQPAAELQSDFAAVAHSPLQNCRRRSARFRSGRRPQPASEWAAHSPIQNCRRVAEGGKRNACRAENPPGGIEAASKYPPSSVVVNTQGQESGGSWFETCSGMWYPRRRPCGVAINTLVDSINWLGKPQVLPKQRETNSTLAADRDAKLGK